MTDRPNDVSTSDRAAGDRPIAGHSDSAATNPTATDAPSSAARSKRRSDLKRWIKIVFSVALLTVVYLKVDFAKLGATLSSLSVSSVALLIVLYSIGQVLSAMKWRLFVHEAGIEGSYLHILRAYLFGMFINSVGFGLGTVGGDVARAIAIFPEKGKRAAAFATVLADRVHGLGVLLAIGVIASLVFRPEEVPLSLVGIGMLGVLAVVGGWVLGPWILTKLFNPSHKFGGAALSVTRAFPRSPLTVIYATMLSAGVHVIQLVMNVVMARELGAALTAGHIFSAVPFVNAASSLPISYNGIGVREFMYSWLFGAQGGSELAIAFGAIWVVIVTVVGILGGLLLPPEMKTAVREEMERRTNVVSFPSADESSDKARNGLLKQNAG